MAEEFDVGEWSRRLAQAINDEIDEEVLGKEPVARKKFMAEFKQAATEEVQKNIQALG